MKGKGEEKEVVKKSVRGRINRGGIVGKEGDELTSSPRIANKGLQLNVDPRAIYPNMEVYWGIYIIHTNMILD